VPGVLGADKGLIPELTADECDELIAQGIATEGMQAKLNAASDAVRRGVGRVEIAPGATPGIVKQVLERQPVGTRIVLGAVRHV
jgi:acetylglutamate kinase